MNLTEFLLARIAEDEEQARDAIRERDRVKFIHPPQVPDMSLQSWPDAPVPTVLVGPERVLAECEAKRRIIRVCEAARYSTFLGDGVLTEMTLPYADHPDFDEAWRA